MVWVSLSVFFDALVSLAEIIGTHSVTDIYTQCAHDAEHIDVVDNDDNANNASHINYTDNLNPSVIDQSDLRLISRITVATQIMMIMMVFRSTLK